MKVSLKQMTPMTTAYDEQRFNIPKPRIIKEKTKIRISSVTGQLSKALLLRGTLLRGTCMENATRRSRSAVVSSEVKGCKSGIHVKRFSERNTAGLGEHVWKTPLKEVDLILHRVK
ncbi:uncharacterized protein LOC135502178 isoform X2 [Lineus longissimus]|uniref:uncharacterized protein LOC135502178 isoform X2 n=1 Tax=Lineus longissimus TaxID=88925 RepID=UPI00315D2660